MTPAHQLIVAAIGLCAFVFLLHIDSVNSIRCKFCFATGPDCESGNVPSIECPAGKTQCLIMTINDTTSPEVSTYRACTGNGSTFCTPVGPQMICNTYCNTDNCN